MNAPRLFPVSRLLSPVSCILLSASLPLFADGPPKADDVPPAVLPGSRIDLFDSATRRVQMVLYYSKARQEPSGGAVFEDFRALILEKEGDSLNEMIERAVGEVRGKTARLDEARMILHVKQATSSFRADPFPAGGKDAGAPSVSPVEVESEALEVRPRENAAVYRGCVRMRQAGSRLEAEELDVSWDGASRALKSACAAGAPAVALLAGGERLEAPEISMEFPSRKVTCRRGGIFLFSVRGGGLGSGSKQ